MKKALTILFASSFCTAALALPIAYEPFNYPLSPTNLIGQTTMDGFAWSVAGSVIGLTNQPWISAGSLTYPGLAPAFGNSVQFGNTTGTNGLAARFSLKSAISSGSVYYSCLLKLSDITGLSSSGVFWAGFNNSAGSQSTVPLVIASRIYTRSAAGGFNFGTSKSSSTASDWVWDTAVHAVNETNFIVARYTFNSVGASDDVADFWINPDPSTFATSTPPSPTLTTSSGGDITSSTINSFLIFNRNTGEPHAVILDQLLIGTSWADVTLTNVPLTITSQPKDQRVVVGGTASFSVSTFNATTFQWDHNNVAIPGATQNSLTLTNVQVADAGTYDVTVGNGVSVPLVSSNALLTLYPDIYPRLVPLWTLAPGSRPYMTTDSANSPNERGFTYSVLSNQVLLVSRTNTITSSTNPAIYVINGDTGADLYQMNVDPGVVSGGINGNAISLNFIDIADDGAVYAANVGDNTSNFRMYYWTDSAASTEPVNIFDGDPAGQSPALRFGDSFAVRGAGANTQIVLDNSTGVAGSILSPQVGHPLSDPWAYGYFTNVATGATGGRTLLFYGTANTFWEKHGSGGGSGGGLVLLAYDTTPGVQSSSIVTNYPNIFVNTPTLVDFNAATNLLFAIDFASSGSVPDTLDQYDMTDPSQPLFTRSYNFPVSHQANANGCGRVIVSGDRVYALDSNNGMLAFRIEPVLSITRSGGNVILAWPASTPGYTLKSTTSLIPPTTWNVVGTGTLIGQQYFVTNSIGGGNLFYRLQK